MELTKKDRVILINQYRILKRLEPEAARHYDELIEILERGYSMCYSRVESSLEESEIPEEVGQFVQDVFTLYQAIGAYKTAHPDDQEVVEHAWAAFRGFDGASEAQYLIFARFLAHHTADENFDSHEPTLSKYRIMLAIYQALGAGELCSAGIRQVLGLNSGTASAPEEEEASTPVAEDEESTVEETEAEEDAGHEEEADAKPKPARKRASRAKT